MRLSRATKRAEDRRYSGGVNRIDNLSLHLSCGELFEIFIAVSIYGIGKRIRVVAIVVQIALRSSEIIDSGKF